MGSGRAWAAWAQPTERGRAAIVPLLPARSGFVGLLRPALRLAQLAGIPNPVERRRWALRTVLGVGSDVGWALLLARTDSELLVPRLMLDVADVASWATCDPRSAAAAVMLNAPLVTEVAVRRTPQRAAMLGAAMLDAALIGDPAKRGAAMRSLFQIADEEAARRALQDRVNRLENGT